MPTNPAGTWVDPAFGSQTGTVLKTNYDNAHAVAKRGADNFAPHESSPAAMTIEVDAGAIWDGTTQTEVAAQTTGLIVAPVTLPRIDRVVRDRVTGAISVVTGVENVTPVPPAITAGTVPVGQIGQLETTTVAITNALISDERPPGRESVIAARGDLLVGDAAGDPSVLAVGTVGQIIVSDGTDPAYRDPPLPRGYQSGCQLANNALDLVWDVDITPGAWRDSTDTENLKLVAALVKQLDAKWAVGTNQGGWSSADIATADTVTFTDNGASPDFVTLDSGVWTATPNLANNMIVTGGLNAGIYRIQLAPTTTRIDVLTGSFVAEAASSAEIRIIPTPTLGGWVHVFLAKRVDTGVVDVIFAASATAPVLPASYTKFRRIGSHFIVTNIERFFQRGDHVRWDNVGAVQVIPGTTAAFSTVKIPPIPGIVWLADLIHTHTVTQGVLVTSPLQADVAATLTNGQMVVNAADNRANASVEIPTDNSQFRHRGSVNGGTLWTSTKGYEDPRGRDD